MCSELLRIPITWHGVPIFGFGVVLAVWLLISAWAIFTSSKVDGLAAALKTHLPTTLLVAAIIAVAAPRLAPSGVPLRSYGLLVVLGGGVGIAMAIRRGRRMGIEMDEIVSLALVMFVAGIVGARLFYVIEYWPTKISQPTWSATLTEMVRFTEGGLVIYGAFAGAMLAFAWFAVRRQLPVLALADLIAPSMLVGLAIGRIGCLMNGCCYGGESDISWAIRFPRENSPSTLSAPYAEQAAGGRFHGFSLSLASEDDPTPVVARVDPRSPADKAGLSPGDRIVSINGERTPTLDAAREQVFAAFSDRLAVRVRLSGNGEKVVPAIEPPDHSLPVHPAQIYSAIDAGLLAWLLWTYYPLRRRDGEVTALMITIHPISRFLLEVIRVDESPVWNTGLSISQNLSVLMLLAAVGLWIYVLRRPPGLALPLARRRQEPAGRNE